MVSSLTISGVEILNYMETCLERFIGKRTNTKEKQLRFERHSLGKSAFLERDMLRRANPEVRSKEQAGTPRHINPQTSKNQIRSSSDLRMFKNRICVGVRGVRVMYRRASPAC